MPASADEAFATLENMEIKTNRGENFCPVINAEKRIIIFTCAANLKFLCKNIENVLMDGTFEYCMPIFTQLFTIHGQKNGFFIPLVYAYLDGKSETSYTNLFEELVKECQKNGLNFSPEVILVDYERAIHNAIASEWPLAKIRGCNFHLTQAWFRKIQAL